MRIQLRQKNTIAGKTHYGSDSPLYDRIGFWATVSEVNSINNRVNVYSDTGILCEGIPVVSNEWVNADDNKDYVTGSRNLPPVGARVFVLMPTHTITGAFVLCSGFAAGEVKTHTLYAEDNSQKKDFNNINEKVTQGGWIEKEDFNTGNRSIESKDGAIKLELNLDNNNKFEQKKSVVLKAFDNVITITPDKKITIEAKQEIVMDASDQKVTLVAKKFSVKSDPNSSIADLEVT